MNFSIISAKVRLAKSEAFALVRPHYGFVGGRGGALLCTADDRGEQCLPNVAADCPFWDGKKASIAALVADVLAHHPHVEEVYIEGAYDGADSLRDFREGVYDCRVEEWSVQVWTRTEGWLR